MQATTRPEQSNKTRAACPRRRGRTGRRGERSPPRGPGEDQPVQPTASAPGGAGGPIEREAGKFTLLNLEFRWMRTNDAQKDKEDLEEVSMELELADEDELVPYVLSFHDMHFCFSFFFLIAKNSGTKLAILFSNFRSRMRSPCSRRRRTRSTRTCRSWKTR